jgi:ACR3 family arsenite efflux pump ArsB
MLFTIFRNPANGHTVVISKPGLWSLLFGPLYFVRHDAWAQALIAFVVAVVTMGLAWLVYPFYAGRIVRNAYRRRGWIQESGVGSLAWEQRKLE